MRERGGRCGGGGQGIGGVVGGLSEGERTLVRPVYRHWMRIRGRYPRGVEKFRDIEEGQYMQDEL